MKEDKGGGDCDNDKWNKTTNINIEFTYPWSSVTPIFRNGYLFHDGDRTHLGVMTPT
jgi:hypothetical protein